MVPTSDREMVVSEVNIGLCLPVAGLGPTSGLCIRELPWVRDGIWCLEAASLKTVVGFYSDFAPVSNLPPGLLVTEYPGLCSLGG